MKLQPDLPLIPFLILLATSAAAVETETTNGLMVESGDVFTIGAPITNRNCSPVFTIMAECGEIEICLTNGAITLTGCMTNAEVAASNFWAIVTKAFPTVREAIKQNATARDTIREIEIIDASGTAKTITLSSGLTATESSNLWWAIKTRRDREAEQADFDRLNQSFSNRLAAKLREIDDDAFDKMEVIFTSDLRKKIDQQEEALIDLHRIVKRTRRWCMVLSVLFTLSMFLGWMNVRLPKHRIRSTPSVLLG